jgi:hypothetical protein
MAAASGAALTLFFVLQPAIEVAAAFSSARRAQLNPNRGIILYVERIRRNTHLLLSTS